MNKPKVSFGLVSYNSMPYLVDSLDAILGMRLPFEYEVVVADDGSSDDTHRILAEYSQRFDGRLRVLHGDQNPYLRVGTGFRIGNNKLRLLLSLRGEYCLCGDGDDAWCDAGFVENAVKILERDETLSAVFHDHRYVGEYERQAESLPLHEGVVPSWLYVSGHYTHYGTFLFRNLVGRGYASLCAIGADDTPLQLWLATLGDFYYCRRVVYSYRQYAKRGWARFDPCILNVASLLLVWRALPVLSGAVRRAFLASYANALEFCLKNRGTIWREFRGRESGFFIDSDFRPKTPMHVLCHWDAADSWSRFKVVAWLWGLVVAGNVCSRLLKKLRRDEDASVDGGKI